MADTDTESGRHRCWRKQTVHCRKSRKETLQLQTWRIEMGRDRKGFEMGEETIADTGM